MGRKARAGRHAKEPSHDHEHAASARAKGALGRPTMVITESIARVLAQNDVELFLRVLTAADLQSAVKMVESLDPPTVERLVARLDSRQAKLLLKAGSALSAEHYSRVLQKSGSGEISCCFCLLLAVVAPFLLRAASFSWPAVALASGFFLVMSWICLDDRCRCRTSRARGPTSELPSGRSMPQTTGNGGADTTSGLRPQPSNVDSEASVQQVSEILRSGGIDFQPTESGPHALAMQERVAQIGAARMAVWMAATRCYPEELALILQRTGFALQESEMAAGLGIARSLPITECPGYAAFMAHRADNFQVLLEHGMDVSSPYESLPLVHGMFACSTPSEDQYAMMAMVLKKHPDVFSKAIGRASSVAVDLVDVAIRSGKVRSIELAMSAKGARLHYDDNEQPAGFIPNASGSGTGFSNSNAAPPTFLPSICTALSQGSVEGLHHLITKHGVLKHWQFRYSQRVIGHLSETLARSAVAAVKAGGRGKFPADLRLVELCLKEGGFNWSWTSDNCNSVLVHLYNAGTYGNYDCALGEVDALRLLRLFKECGWEVAKPGMPGSEDRLLNLLGLAIKNDQLSIVDFAIDECGLPAQGLALAIATGVARAAIHLLARHDSLRLRSPGLPLQSQPIYHLFSPVDRYTDDEALPVVEAFIRRSASFLVDDQGSVSSQRTQAQSLTLPHVMMLAAMAGKAKCIEAMLQGGVEGARELACKPCLVDGRLVSPVQMAAKREHWEAVTVLVNKAGAKVTESFPSQGSAEALGSVLTMVHSAATSGARVLPGSVAVPRFVMALVTSAGTREQEHTRSSDLERRRIAIGAGTNAFEQARALHASYLGDGNSAVLAPRSRTHSGSSDDEDDDGASEGRDDNLVDSRYAPSLDLMLAEFAVTGRNPGSASSSSPSALQARSVSSFRPSGGSHAAVLRRRVAVASNSFEDPSMLPMGHAVPSSRPQDDSDDEEPLDEPDDNLVDSRYAPSLDLMLAAFRRQENGLNNSEH